MISDPKRNRSLLRWQRKLGKVVMGILSVFVVIGILIGLYHLVKFHW